MRQLILAIRDELIKIKQSLSIRSVSFIIPLLITLLVVVLAFKQLSVVTGQLDSARLQLRLSNRPYVSIQALVPFDRAMTKTDHYIGCHMKIVNSGLLPASNIDIKLSIDDGYGSRPVPKYLISTIFPSQEIDLKPLIRSVSPNPKEIVLKFIISYTGEKKIGVYKYWYSYKGKYVPSFDGEGKLKGFTEEITTNWDDNKKSNAPVPKLKEL